MAGRFRAVRSQDLRPRQTSRKASWMTFVLAIMVLILSLVIYADFRVRPMVAASARMIAKRAATEALNEAVTAELAQDVDYEKIVRVEGKQGSLTAAHFDFAKVTELQSAATERADAALRSLANTTLRLPFAQVVGGSLFTTFTPIVPVRMTLMGDAHSSVQMETRTVGVNQSVHIIYLDISADMSVVSPLVSTPLSITSRIPVAYVVLMGEVPKTYLGKGADSFTSSFSAVTPSQDK